MLLTKRTIIDLLKETKTATIMFYGRDKVQVKNRRQEVILSVIEQTEQYNQMHPDAQVDVLVKGGVISAGASHVFLPAYPRTGDVVVRSIDYTVDGVHCAFIDIVTESFVSTGQEWQFMTKNGSIISGK